MPRTLTPDTFTEAVVDTRVRGVLQITRQGEMWNCAVAIYNSQQGLSKATLTSEQVVDLFQSCNIPLPTEAADCHVIEFFDGPVMETWTELGFRATV